MSNLTRVDVSGIVALTSLQVPAIQVPASVQSLADGYSVVGIAPNARAYSPGETASIVPKLNANALLQDLVALYGGGMGYAVGMGLGLSKPGGLTLSMAPGHALLPSIVEVAAARTTAVPDNHPGTPTTPTDRVYAWLTQAGALTCAVGITPPAGACVYVGNCTTSGGAILAIDVSGVVYRRGGVLWRQLADIGAPRDSPPQATQFFCRTLGGLYYWDGTAYTTVGAAVAAAIMSGAASASATQDDIDRLEAKLRRLLGQLLVTIGPDAIPDEMQTDAELGLAEAGPFL